MIRLNRQSIALYCMLLGLILTIIPLFSFLVKADATGATITISGVYSSNGDASRIENTVKKINDAMFANEIVDENVMVSGNFEKRL